METRVVADATCLACGCLCDDIVATALGGRVVEAARACPIGRTWFLADRGRAGRPVAAVDGRAVEPAEAVDRAAEILGGARSPVVLGLSASTIEAQSAASAIADRIGAAIDVGHAAEATPRHRAIQRAGRVSASLGEVKARADVVVFWGVDPVLTHPRHFERYSVEPTGRFVSSRTVLVADSAPTATSARADAFLAVPEESRFDVLQALRMIVRGMPTDSIRQVGGIAAGTLAGWAAHLVEARYGAFFHGGGLAGPPGDSATFEEAMLLVRDLNLRGPHRFVALGMGGPGNPAGAEAVLAWQAGHASAVDLARGTPEYLPGVTSALDRLLRGEADAALIVGETGSFGWSAAVSDALDRIPVIRVAPGAPSGEARPGVALDAAEPGIEAGGTVCRVDGVMLPLRPPLESALPTERDWLDWISARLSAP